jgi:hypothetical protein
MHETSPVAETEDRDEWMPGVSRAKGFFLIAAFLSFLMSVYLFFTGDPERGIFVGLWVPSILSAGALLLGHDAHGGDPHE